MAADRRLTNALPVQCQSWLTNLSAVLRPVQTPGFRPGTLPTHGRPMDDSRATHWRLISY